MLADQRGTYDRMRVACPVARSPRGVTLFRHADVVAAAADPATFSSAVSARRMVPNSLDQPEHTAFRLAIDPFFTPERMGGLKPRVRRIAHEIVGALPRGTTVDAVTEIGYPLAVRAQSDWLGWRGVGERPDYPAVFVSDGHGIVTLWQVESPSKANAFDRRANVGLHHLALAVVDRAGLEALHKRVSSWPGVEVEFGPQASGAGPKIHFMVREPSGVRIEFALDPRLESSRKREK